MANVYIQLLLHKQDTTQYKVIFFFKQSRANLKLRFMFA